LSGIADGSATQIHVKVSEYKLFASQLAAAAAAGRMRSLVSL